VREVFGPTSTSWHGALPEMLRLLMNATTHLVFDADALPQAEPLVRQLRREEPSILLEHGIDPEDVDDVLVRHYT
jgi:hypothetical protein